MTRHFPEAVPAFDEGAYLASNPDVSASVRRGEYSSGLEHFFAYGAFEGRPGIRRDASSQLEIFLAQASALPLPPPHLRRRAHGDDDLPDFEAVGRRIAFNLHHTLQPDFKFDVHQRVLDFGVGCGRVLRYFQLFLKNASFYGCDIDQEAVAWCQQELHSIGSFFPCGDLPPLPFPAGSFDLVYAVSVFTHLPEAMQLDWLAELSRLLRPGGRAIFTTHGPQLYTGRSKRASRRLHEMGFLYTTGGRTPGLPGYYRTAYHSHDYIRACWGRFFRIEKIIPRGIGGHQDLVLCLGSG